MVLHCAGAGQWPAGALQTKLQNIHSTLHSTEFHASTGLCPPLSSVLDWLTHLLPCSQVHEVFTACQQVVECRLWRRKCCAACWADELEPRLAAHACGLDVPCYLLGAWAVGLGSGRNSSWWGSRRRTELLRTCSCLQPTRQKQDKMQATSLMRLLGPGTSGIHGRIRVCGNHVTHMVAAAPCSSAALTAEFRASRVCLQPTRTWPS
jgi:hypothetical protein